MEFLQYCFCWLDGLQKGNKMAEFKIKLGALQLRSTGDPYIMAEFVFENEDGSELILGAYESKAKGWVLKVDFKEVENNKRFFYEDYKKLEHILLVMTSLFLTEEGKPVVVSRMEPEAYDEIKHMMDDMVEGSEGYPEEEIDDKEEDEE